jgi:hypothetical protein
MSSLRNLEGLTINFMTIVKRALHNDSRGGACWHCHCKCGVEKIVRGEHLVSGRVKSCGCLKNAERRQRKCFDHNFRILHVGLCWEWRSHRNGKGQPVFYNGECARLYAWNTFNGEIPQGKKLKSTCGNLGCVNPSHMSLTEG